MSMPKIILAFLKAFLVERTSLDRNSPIPRRVHPPQDGKVVARPYLGGLHHRYARAA